MAVALSKAANTMYQGEHVRITDRSISPMAHDESVEYIYNSAKMIQNNEMS